MSGHGAHHGGAPALVQVVDDDPVTWLVIEKVLKKLGLRSVHARTLDEARQQLLTHPVDVMIMDGWLPDGRGPEMVEFIRTSLQYMDLPVVFCSSDAGAHRGQLDGLGVEAILGKPINAAELRDAVRNALKKATNRWEPARVAADRLGISLSEFEDMLRVMHRELCDLLDQLQAASEHEDPDAGERLRPLLARVRSSALNVGAVRLAQGMKLLNLEELSTEEVRLAADMVRVEINVNYGPFRGLVREGALESA